jgi:6-pyruvoyltetrahydropterin/6-carboxytetrahydropterin synthase
MDFGALKPLKATLEYWFDHTLVVAQDDPSLHALTALGDVSLAQIRVMPAVGCEKFAEFAWHLANKFLISNGFSDRVNVTLVEVSEHGANSAIYMSRVNP